MMKCLVFMAFISTIFWVSLHVTVLCVSFMNNHIGLRNFIVRKIENEFEKELSRIN